MLDDKLRGILNRDIPDTDEQEQSLVDAIKQAFTDEGYTYKNEVYTGSGRAFTTDHKEVMTGKEWLDRFKKEYRTLSPNAYAKDRYAKMAAEKASGI